ncbi:MAG: DegQ family serine endoprotease [candidate division NC10 bacterium]|jgi:serine protease Do|nr:DegQ family serine endoprotease [candidate division NC10 bacterium]
MRHRGIKVFPGGPREIIVVSLVFFVVLLLSRPVGADRRDRGLVERMQGVFVEVAERLKPSVVNINTTQKVQTSRRQIEPFFRGPFREFFGEEFFERFFKRPRNFERRSLGSGVIVDAKGYILTNNHVVEQADEIQVTLVDERSFRAKVIGTDPKTDLAVIQIEEATDLHPAALGDSSKMRTGDFVIAIGNPFGLSHTVTVGVVSATRRAGMGITAYEDFIQTDASINPGNSGGPLLNIDGEVIGINTAILASGQGIGFAIPINLAKEIMEQLIKEGQVVRGWLGVVIQPLTPELAPQFGVKPRGGVLIADLVEGGPAETAGLKTGDVLLTFAGKPVTDIRQLQQLVATVRPGKRVAVKIKRKEQTLTLDVTVGRMPTEETVAVAPKTLEQHGFAVQDLTPELRERFQVKEGGVLVSSVEPGSPAFRRGLRSGDVILEANRHPVQSRQGLLEILRTSKPDTDLLLLVRRGKNTHFLVVPSVKG